MRRGLTMAGLLALGACGGPPVLSHVPRPDPAVVAAAAAALAGAATLADPQAAHRIAEHEPDPAERRPAHREDMPSDVLDRLDAADAERAAGER
jgi:hypothetical protein